MESSNKFELAAELTTEAKRNLYLSQIFALKPDNKQMMDSIDTIKLAEEEHSQDLLLSKNWQQGYECYKSRSQKKLNDLLRHALFTATTKLSAAASLDIGTYFIDDLKDNGLLSEQDSKQLMKELKEQASNINAKSFSMYDPEIHPYLGEFVKDGKERLYYWSNKNLKTYP